MEKAAYYDDLCLISTKFVPKLVEEYESRWLQWGNNRKVIEIGCGPGRMTFQNVLTYIPKNGHLTAVDYSGSMLEYARSKYHDPRLSFENMDITDENAAKERSNSFDTVFSFFVFHYVPQQKLGFQNILEMMKPGGEALICFFSEISLYQSYADLAKDFRFKEYMQDYKEHIPPHYSCNDVPAMIKNMMTNIGFNILECYEKGDRQRMPNEKFICDMLETFDPFIHRLPQEMRSIYKKRTMEILFGKGLFDIEEVTGTFILPYRVLIVLAEKPLK